MSFFLKCEIKFGNDLSFCCEDVGELRLSMICCYLERFHDGYTFAIRWRHSRVVHSRCHCSLWSRINWTKVHRHDRLCYCLCRCEWYENCSLCRACCRNSRCSRRCHACCAYGRGCRNLQNPTCPVVVVAVFPVVLARVIRTPTVAVACDGGGSLDIGGGVVDNLQQISEQVALEIRRVARLAAGFEQFRVGGKDVPQFRVEEDLAAGFQVGYLRTVAYVVHDAFPIFAFNIIRLTDRHVERRTVLTGAKLGHHIAH
ncbi:hypothetical protein T07_6038 [Trichinella nelsoni]|uniref:Uncharacterized protein n=1 Tax=Trichinella nelsoni TaxID=6336 RepID=A0A0V0RL29_9BILA|nr:hypothetical protein T07_6038 [Trichinella nelsoni]